MQPAVRRLCGPTQPLVRRRVRLPRLPATPRRGRRRRQRRLHDGGGAPPHPPPSRPHPPPPRPAPPRREHGTRDGENEDSGRTVLVPATIHRPGCPGSIGATADASTLN